MGHGDGAHGAGGHATNVAMLPMQEFQTWSSSPWDHTLGSALVNKFSDQVSVCHRRTLRDRVVGVVARPQAEPRLQSQCSAVVQN
jgi:hypothetical protein